MKIAVLCGGRSNERDVSLSTGTTVARALRKSGHDVVILDACVGMELTCSPDEVFTMNLPIEDYSISDESPDVRSFFERKEGFFGRNVLEICRAADIVFNALHGAEGENGKLQATFDLIGIRYTGSSAQGCMLAMNKCIAKQLFSENGIPTPPGIYLNKSDYDSCITPEFGFPCVVKPGSLGSSVGVSIARDERELEAAIETAFRFEDLVIIEKYIHGREFSVGIVGGRKMPAIEIVPKQGFYDYKNKYQPGFTEEICPADIDAETAEKMGDTALKVYRVLGLGAYARVDFMLDETGFYCLEANTLPGMTPLSLLPQEAAAAGIDFPALLEIIIEESLNINRLY
ncbi:MAG: D-alanine--D-alanine ligase [Christensenellaceae bacterium]|nr:D-alanine--D-alanine ligase [Christensenellaceae bacterium]